jgi:hypothetical protein
VDGTRSVAKRARAVFHIDRSECKGFLLHFSQLRVVEFSRNLHSTSKYIRAWRLFITSTIGNAVRGRMHVLNASFLDTGSHLKARANLIYVPMLEKCGV